MSVFDTVSLNVRAKVQPIAAGFITDGTISFGYHAVSEPLLVSRRRWHSRDPMSSIARGAAA